MFPLLHFLYILQDSFRIDESYFLFKGSLDVVGAIQDGDVNLWKLVLWSVQWGSINALAYRFMQKVLDKRYAFLTLIANPIQNFFFFVFNDVHLFLFLNLSSSWGINGHRSKLINWQNRDNCFLKSSNFRRLTDHGARILMKELEQRWYKLVTFGTNQVDDFVLIRFCDLVLFRCDPWISLSNFFLLFYRLIRLLRRLSCSSLVDFIQSDLLIVVSLLVFALESSVFFFIEMNQRSLGKRRFFIVAWIAPFTNQIFVHL